MKSLSFVFLNLAFITYSQASGGSVTLHPDRDQTKCLDAASNVDGAAVTIGDCFNTASQQWSFSGGSIKIFGNKCLDVIDGVEENGTKLQIWTCYDENTNQQFNAWDDHIAWAHRGLCLDLIDGNTAGGTFVQIWECSRRNPNQIWHWQDSVGPAVTTDVQAPENPSLTPAIPPASTVTSVVTLTTTSTEIDTTTVTSVLPAAAASTIVITTTLTEVDTTTVTSVLPASTITITTTSTEVDLTTITSVSPASTVIVTTTLTETDATTVTSVPPASTVTLATTSTETDTVTTTIVTTATITVGPQPTGYKCHPTSETGGTLRNTIDGSNGLLYCYYTDVACTYYKNNGQFSQSSSGNDRAGCPAAAVPVY
ncbi:hypothetical protein VKT23_009405 [Stygiomarasmius scandens]|uniref:Ricin B lectin domain-containing protein n=1 Tax=Marasmiellus scandens TaxID=2682957 RepID=A0ABR1JGE8_9AGAR